jgi:hypothetical protein
MRNVDKVRKLNYELGRFRKKIDDQEEKIKKLEKELEMAYGGNMEMHAQVDGILCQMVLCCGKDVFDFDDPEKVIGKNITIPRFNPMDLVRKYEVHTELYEESNEMVIGIMEREQTE